MLRASRRCSTALRPPAVRPRPHIQHLAWRALSSDSFVFAEYTFKDLWSKEEQVVAMDALDGAVYQATVPGNGGSRIFKMSP